MNEVMYNNPGGVQIVYPNMIWAPEQQYVTNIGQPQSQQMNLPKHPPLPPYHYRDPHHPTSLMSQQVQQEGVEELKSGNDTPYYAAYSK